MVEGVLITGGYKERSTELFLPHTGKTCNLQSIPRLHDAEGFHSMNSLSNQIILCGGGDASSRTSCFQFLTTSSSGSWANYATLAQSRSLHTTHVFQDQLLIMGGRESQGTTEMVGEGMHYNLHQDTKGACSIQDVSSTILTGGISGSVILKSVVRYDMQGFVENLPDLSQERLVHGCGIYINQLNIKVLVVAGGRGPGIRLSSTELLPAGDKSWQAGVSLPRPLDASASLNMGTHFLIIGGHDYIGRATRSEILKFNGTWSIAGMMKTARFQHAATKIAINPSGPLNIAGCN